MNELVITIQTILAIFGGITCIVGGLSAIAKLFSPFKNLCKEVEDHNEQLKDGDKKMDRLDTAITQIEETDKIICKSLLVLLNHEITGNSIDKLKEQRDALEDFLVEK